VIADLQLFRQLIDQSNDAIYIVDLETGGLLYGNERLALNLGYDPPDLLRLSITDIAGGAPDNKSWKTFIEQATRRDESFFESRHQHKNGRYFPVEVSHRLVRMAEKSYVICISRNIPEPQQTEAFLEEKSQVEAVMAALGDGLTMQNRDFVIVYQNLAHQKRQGMRVGEQCFRAYHGREEICEGCLLVECFEDGEIHRRETVANTEKGLLHLEVVACPVRNARGEIIAGVEVVRDITDLRRSEGQLRQLLESAGEGIIGMDPEGNCTICNRAAALMLGIRDRADLVGRNVHDTIHHARADGANHPRHECRILQAVQKGEICTAEDESFRRADGECFPVEYRAYPILQEQNVIGGVLFFSDHTEQLRVKSQLREHENRLQYLAHHDTLTHLPNRLLFNDRLHHALNQARRSKHQIALLFLDLDRFKNINDTLGHETGDAVLCEVARRLQSHIREADTIARLGGDEFLVIIEQLNDPSHAATVARKFLDALAQPMQIGRHELTLTGSIGISIFPDDTRDLEGLMKCADIAMYQAKESGRNNYQFYKPEMNAHAHDLLVLEGNLRKALNQDQLFLHYQPQFDLFSGEIIGMEALVRWLHPEWGVIFPFDFISLAEETGMIVAIGEWVLRTACRQSKSWQEAGYAPLRMAVNISGRQFKQPDFIAMVESCLAETGLDPSGLELEITESTLIDDLAGVIDTMHELKTRGIHLAIDDFGTGYSSLNHLKRFPIGKLKIDRSFIRDIGSEAHDAAIARAIIALGRSMSLEVIAEGIETADQLQFLKDEGCRFGQGFLFSRPIIAEELRRSFLQIPSAGKL